MRRGQLESAFQWIFVVLAGGAFLVFFFVLLRGCTQQGEERVQGLSLQAASEFLESQAWQEESTTRVTLPSASVYCPAGTVTLSTERAQAGLSGLPGFISPSIGGRSTVLTKPVRLHDELPIGNVIYVMDGSTYYLVIVDSRGGYGLLEETGAENIVRVPLDDIRDPDRLAARVPRSARTVILVTDKNAGYISNADVSGIDADTSVLGVHAADSASFYERRDGAMRPVARLPAVHELLALGAAVSGDPALYRCGHAHFTARAERLAQVYSERAAELAQEAPRCADLLLEAEQRLGGELFSEGRRLASLQSSLLQRSCPVIA